MKFVVAQMSAKDYLVLIFVMLCCYAKLFILTILSAFCC